MESASNIKTCKEIPKRKYRGLCTSQDYSQDTDKVDIPYEKFKNCFNTNNGIINTLLLKAGKAGNIPVIQFCVKMGARVNDVDIILGIQKDLDVLQALFGDPNTYEPSLKDKKSINKFLLKNIDLVLLNSLACPTTESVTFALENHGNPNFVFKSRTRLMCPGYMAILLNDREKLAVLFQHGATIEPNQYMSLLAFSLLVQRSDMTLKLAQINDQDDILFHRARCKRQSTDALNKPIDLKPYVEFAKDMQCDPNIIALLQEYAEIQRYYQSIPNKSKAGASKKFKKNTST